MTDTGFTYPGAGGDGTHPESELNPEPADPGLGQRQVHNSTTGPPVGRPFPDPTYLAAQAHAAGEVAAATAHPGRRDGAEVVPAVVPDDTPPGPPRHPETGQFVARENGDDE